MKGGEQWHSAGIKDDVSDVAAAGIAGVDFLAADIVEDGAAGDFLDALVTECESC